MSALPAEPRLLSISVGFRSVKCVRADEMNGLETMTLSDGEWFMMMGLSTLMRRLCSRCGFPLMLMY